MLNQTMNGLLKRYAPLCLITSH